MRAGHHVGLAQAQVARDIGAVREEADLDALVTRIQSDLRSGRGPRAHDHGELAERERRLRAEIRAIRGRSLRRIDIRRRAARWLAPLLIFAVVLVATLLFGGR